jgi:hypothetical protein
MKFKKKEEKKETHHTIEYNGYEIHRREKLVYDFKEKIWVRKHLIWEVGHSRLDTAYQFNNKPQLPSSKQLEREYQLMLLGI